MVSQYRWPLVIDLSGRRYAYPSRQVVSQERIHCICICQRSSFQVLTHPPTSIFVYLPLIMLSWRTQEAAFISHRMLRCCSMICRLQYVYVKSAWPPCQHIHSPKIRRSTMYTRRYANIYDRLILHLGMDRTIVLCCWQSDKHW